MNGMEDPTEYLETLTRRTDALEKEVQKIQQLRHEEKTFLKTHGQDLKVELQNIRIALDKGDASLHALAREVRHVVGIFQHVASKEALERVERQTDLILLDSWITRKEFKKMLEE